tara:strand:+ start:501 stop:1841 length:1341 start_codon:yes stop_codon:yes gene_type:complete
MRLANIILFISICFFSQAAFSQTYYWGASSSENFPTPQAACDARWEIVKDHFMGLGYQKGGYKLASGSLESNPTLCLLTGPDASADSNFYSIYRYGDSCPEGQDINLETGSCSQPEPDKCEEKSGTEDFFSKTGDIDDGYTSTIKVGSKKYIASPQDGCMGGCKVRVTTDCKNRIGTNSYRCSGPATYTGESCTATDGSPQLEQKENYVADEPKNTEIKEPCIYTTDGEGRSVCVSKASLDKEGQNCGDYNGEILCVPKQAEFDDKTVETEVTEKTDADGGKTTVKKDTATVTNCKGAKTDCTTTTTTTTTTTKSDGSGATTSTTVECKGKDCGSGVGGGGTGSGSSDGDDDQDVPGELEGQDEVAGFGESLQDFNTRISAAPILATVTSIAMPRGGSCSMPSANIPVIGSISFNWICDNSDLLDPLYYVMLAIWALFATRVFLEA